MIMIITLFKCKGYLAKQECSYTNWADYKSTEIKTNGIKIYVGF